ncbi:LysR family transcriptional regulator [Pseudoxanthomonas sp.]|uniref:LysR family transcriptional regulator n=1 Tax=Pseudoxanthomonas sp. TaxID=1871049 RepID=UPI0025FF45D6|nr:LysR family transcriptional regulator [Pseudoxanthomonas sp.]
MNRLDAMQAFVRVAEMASFTRAADSLGLPKASVSTAVQQLEAWLGTQLLHRTTRRVQLTQDGQAFYERSQDLLADMDEVQHLFARSPQALRGRLRVDMPARFARHFVLPHLPAFLHEHPQLALELSCTDRRVDVVREGFDCVLRVGTLADTSLIARPLGQLRVVTCASPAYLQRHGVPQSPDDLHAHRLIHYSSQFGGKPDGWEYWDGTRYASVPMEGALTVNSSDAYEAACIAGLGLIQAPVAGLRTLVEQGLLEEVLPQYAAEPMPVTLLYAHRRHLPQRVQAFMAWLTETTRPYLDA